MSRHFSHEVAPDPLNGASLRSCYAPYLGRMAAYGKADFADKDPLNVNVEWDTTFDGPVGVWLDRQNVGSVYHFNDVAQSLLEPRPANPLPSQAIARRVATSLAARTDQAVELSSGQFYVWPVGVTPEEQARSPYAQVDSFIFNGLAGFLEKVRLRQDLTAEGCFEAAESMGYMPKPEAEAQLFRQLFLKHRNVKRITNGLKVIPVPLTKIYPTTVGEALERTINHFGNVVVADEVWFTSCSFPRRYVSPRTRAALGAAIEADERFQHIGYGPNDKHIYLLDAPGYQDGNVVRALYNKIEAVVRQYQHKGTVSVPQEDFYWEVLSKEKIPGSNLTLKNASNDRRLQLLLQAHPDIAFVADDNRHFVAITPP